MAVARSQNTSAGSNENGMLMLGCSSMVHFTGKEKGEDPQFSRGMELSRQGTRGPAPKFSWRTFQVLCHSCGTCVTFTLCAPGTLTLLVSRIFFGLLSDELSHLHRFLNTSPEGKEVLGSC